MEWELVNSHQKTISGNTEFFPFIGNLSFNINRYLYGKMTVFMMDVTKLPLMVIS